MSSPDSDRLAGASQRTVEMRTARVFAGMRRGEPLGELISRSEGAADFARRRTRVVESSFLDKGEPPRKPPSPNAPGLANRAKQLADRAGGEVFGRLLGRTMRKPKETLYDGGCVFTRFEPEGPWMSFTPRRPDGPRHPNDPLWLLDLLVVAGDKRPPPRSRRGQGRPHRALPPETRRRGGRRAHLGRHRRSRVGAPIRALRRLPAEVWLDADGRVRRMSHMVESPDEVPDGPMWSTTELDGFGSSVDLPEPPDEAETYGL